MRRISLVKRSIITAIVLAVVTVGLSATVTFYQLDYRLVDSLYQTGDKGTGNVFVIGIDNYALDEFGAWPWSRDVIADVLFTLNADEENQPAAIGVDILYVDETDAFADDWLVAAGESGDNIVMGLTVEYDTKLVTTEEGEAYMDPYAVGYINRPFEALDAVVEVGHTNAMYDADGVLRHHLWSVDTGEEDTLSMPYKLYELYCQYWGLEADFDPPRSTKGFWWVDFGSAPGELYAYSVADILYGEYDAELLKGSIVLIGPYDAGMTDYFITPADRAESMYGVAYLANVTDAMLRDAEKFEFSDTFHQVIMVALAIALGFLLLRLTMVKTVILCAVLSVGTMWCSLLLYDWGWVIRPLGLLMVVVLAMVTSLVEHYAVVYLDRHHITTTFQRYVDPTIVKELMIQGSDALTLGGEMADIALLFVDIREFTSLSAQCTPQEVVHILNEYLTLTSRCIKRHGGTVDKFMGDCTMAFWGAPLPCEDATYQASCAAMEIMEEAQVLSQTLEGTYGRTIAVGVGIHFGPAVVGNIGATDRMDYTAVGDTVNTAARLEANAPAGQIYISRAVADALGERGQTHSLGTSVKLRGKGEDFEVLVLQGIEKKKAEEELPSK